MAHHKRNKPNNTRRGGCKMCKPWKRTGMRYDDIKTEAANQDMEDQMDELESEETECCSCDPESLAKSLGELAIMVWDLLDFVYNKYHKEGEDWEWTCPFHKALAKKVCWSPPGGSEDDLDKGEV